MKLVLKSAFVLCTALACALPTAAASAAGPGAGIGRGTQPLLCPGDTTPSPFAISLASRAWSAAQEVGGHRVLVPTSFAFATYTGDVDRPETYQLTDPRASLIAAKGSADPLGSVTCIALVVESTSTSFTAIVVNGMLQP